MGFPASQTDGNELCVDSGANEELGKGNLAARAAITFHYGNGK